MAVQQRVVVVAKSFDSPQRAAIATGNGWAHVSWTRPIPSIGFIDRICDLTGATSGQVVLAAFCQSVNQCCRQSGLWFIKPRWLWFADPIQSPPVWFDLKQRLLPESSTWNWLRRRRPRRLDLSQMRMIIHFRSVRPPLTTDKSFWKHLDAREKAGRTRTGYFQKTLCSGAWPILRRPFYRSRWKCWPVAIRSRVPFYTGARRRRL
jgi:hypothetical protein